MNHSNLTLENWIWKSAIDAATIIVLAQPQFSKLMTEYDNRNRVRHRWFFTFSVHSCANASSYPSRQLSTGEAWISIEHETLTLDEFSVFASPPHFIQYFYLICFNSIKTSKLVIYKFCFHVLNVRVGGKSFFLADAHNFRVLFIIFKL